MPPLSIRRKMQPEVTTRRRAALRLVTDLELPSSDLEELEWLPDLAGVDDDDAQLTTVAHRSSGRCDRIEIDLDIEDSGERPIPHFAHAKKSSTSRRERSWRFACRWAGASPCHSFSSSKSTCNRKSASRAAASLATTAASKKRRRAWAQQPTSLGGTSSGAVRASPRVGARFVPRDSDELPGT